MSIQTEIDRIRANIASAYAAAEELGAAMPETRLSDRLPAAIRSIPCGGFDFSIEITTPPTKTSYYVGETFNPAGMAVRGTFSNGLTVDIPHEYLTFFPAGELNDSIDKVAVSFQSGNMVQTVYQTISVEEAPEFEWYSLGMTSNNTPIPYVASASSAISNAENQPYCGFNSEKQQFYHSNNISNSWLQVDFGVPTIIAGVRIVVMGQKTTGSKYNYKNCIPRVFTLYGSNDGVNFFAIYTNKGASETTPFEYENRDYYFSNSVEFRYYRFQANGSNWENNNYLVINELQFYKAFIMTTD